jgi:Ca2+/H+ antiporter
LRNASTFDNGNSTTVATQTETHESHEHEGHEGDSHEAEEHEEHKDEEVKGGLALMAVLIATVYVCYAMEFMAQNAGEVSVLFIYYMTNVCVF